jgi:parallel beta-helix repeat protein
MMVSFRPILVLATVLSLYGSARSATYYVDFDGENDSTAGTSPDQAWKHCPGDPEARDKAAAVNLAGGDRVLFRGGVVYRGSIVARQSGEEGKPILYDGNSGLFGAGRAIIDGSEVLTGWKKCASAEEADGNPNWASIWRTEVPYPLPDPKAANLYEGQAALFAAYDPNMKCPWEPDATCEYYAFDPNRATTTSIQDEKVFVQSTPHAWDGAFVGMRLPDGVMYFRITGFDPTAHKITFQENKAIFGAHKGPKGELQYCLLNSLAIMNHPGLCVVRSRDRKSEIFIWPHGSGEPSDITVTRRQVGFNINGQSHLTIQEFWIRKFVNFGSRECGTAILDDENKPNGGLVIRDNLITGCNRTLGSGKTAAISLSGLKGSRVENNSILDNYGSVGIRILKGAGHVIKGNEIRRCGGVGILLWQDSKNCQVIGNTIADNTVENLAGHSPIGMLLYKGCENVLIFGNTIVNNGQRPLALYEPDGNITIACNVFRHRGGYVIEGFGKVQNVRTIHNVLICDDPRGRIFQGGIQFGAQDNILIASGPGLDRGTGLKIDESHNLCADLAHLGDIFVDSGHGDYHLKKGSPAIGAGVVTEIKEDATGKAFAEDRAPDIGAYQSK